MQWHEIIWTHQWQYLIDESQSWTIDPVFIKLNKNSWLTKFNETEQKENTNRRWNVMIEEKVEGCVCTILQTSVPVNRRIPAGCPFHSLSFKTKCQLMRRAPSPSPLLLWPYLLWRGLLLWRGFDWWNSLFSLPENRTDPMSRFCNNFLTLWINIYIINIYFYIKNRALFQCP